MHVRLRTPLAVVDAVAGACCGAKEYCTVLLGLLAIAVMDSDAR